MTCKKACRLKFVTLHNNCGWPKCMPYHIRTYNCENEIFLLRQYQLLFKPSLNQSINSAYKLQVTWCLIWTGYSSPRSSLTLWPGRCLSSPSSSSSATWSHTSLCPLGCVMTWISPVSNTSINVSSRILQITEPKKFSPEFNKSLFRFGCVYYYNDEFRLCQISISFKIKYLYVNAFN